MENTSKRYYVDFYDMIDEWGTFGFFTDKLFDDIDDAKKKCDELNSQLPRGNKDCGEHYGVIDSQTMIEVHCGMDKEYKKRIVDGLIELTN